jgi:hypothetical protein
MSAFLGECQQLQEIMRLREEILLYAARTTADDPRVLVEVLGPMCAAWQSASSQFLSSPARLAGAAHLDALTKSGALTLPPKSPCSTTASLPASATASPASVSTVGQEGVPHPLEMEFARCGAMSPGIMPLSPLGCPRTGASTSSLSPMRAPPGLGDLAALLEDEEVEEAPDAPQEMVLSTRPAAVPTVGSALHASGSCKPCAFFHTKGCANGADCQFCHLCEKEEKRRRQQARWEVKKMEGRVRRAASRATNEAA